MHPRLTARTPSKRGDATRLTRPMTALNVAAILSEHWDKGGLCAQVVVGEDRRETILPGWRKDSQNSHFPCPSITVHFYTCFGISLSFSAVPENISLATLHPLPFIPGYQDVEAWDIITCADWKPLSTLSHDGRGGTGPP